MDDSDRGRARCRREKALGPKVDVDRVVFELRPNAADGTSRRCLCRALGERMGCKLSPKAASSPNYSLKRTAATGCAILVFIAATPLSSSVEFLGRTMSQSDAKEELIIAPVPALVAVLLRLEQEKGSPLTEAEVIAARDGAACIAMPRHAYEAVTAARGYDDINPESAWEEWQRIRATLVTAEA